jgi:hypothetical protein
MVVCALQPTPRVFRLFLCRPPYRAEEFEYGRLACRVALQIHFTFVRYKMQHFELFLHCLAIFLR